MLGYVFHLVRIENKTASSLPKLDTVRKTVRIEWLAEQRKVMNKAFYKALRQRYEIVIKNPPKKDSVASTK